MAAYQVRRGFIVDVFNLLPNLNVSELIKAFAVKTNDMLLVIFLSSLIRSVIALHNLINNREVDRYDDLLSGMRNKGYIGSIKRRTREAMDGCAIFWKENLFCLLEGESIEFKGFGLRDNVAQLFVFEILDVHLD
ncbi:carbon catabolite repressor protein 4 homolog 3-like isoform X4 [Tasmannia lanceolata]|uniref:carbon catabolite repressor protein 4 homolog 3-like isoform X4 n=1 Tax=Tasmannia lanceolata TaxID=3420 RepID=UPI004062E6C0